MKCVLLAFFRYSILSLRHGVFTDQVIFRQVFNNTIFRENLSFGEHEP